MAFLIYSTVSNFHEASRIAKMLIEEKLVACANITDSVTSYYLWEGKVQEDQEVSIVLKTDEEHVDEAMQRIKALHSYECPAIVAIKLDKADEDFTKWLETSLKLS